MRTTEKWIPWICMSLAAFVFHTGTGLCATQGPNPMELIKKSTGEVLRILKDPALKNNQKKREELLWEVISKRFDFWEMSKRTLALHWRKRTEQQRKEFADLFSHLLFKSYIGKMDQYTDERIEYEKEIVTGSRAKVITKVIGKGMEATIEYKLLRRSDDWKIYDVVIEGVSLVSNYRTQFNKIVVSSGYDELIKKLRAKKEELEREQQAKAGHSD